MLVEGKKISEEEWIDEDIAEQTCIDAIEWEGSILDVLDDEALAVDIPHLHSGLMAFPSSTKCMLFRVYYFASPN